MLAFIQQLFKRVSSSASIIHRKARGRMHHRSHEHSALLGIERLESRMMLFGDITDPAGFDFERRLIEFDDFPFEDEPLNAFHDFTLGESAVVLARLTDFQKRDFLGPTPIATLHIGKTEDNRFIELERELFAGGFHFQDLSVRLPPGQYQVLVSNSVNVNEYVLAMHADTAVPETETLVSAGEVTGLFLNSSSGVQLGALSTASGVALEEYVGLSTEAPDDRDLTDEVDLFVFDLVKQGTVKVVVGNDLNIRTVALDFTLYRDVDGDGTFGFFPVDQTEAIATVTEIRSGDTGLVSLDLPPGRYGIEVRVSEETDIFGEQIKGAATYRLSTTYTVADGAGNTRATARPVGAVSDFFKTFNDYISPNDPNDFYKFDTVGNGPFVFEGTLSGMAPGSDFDLDLFLDQDGDGNLDAEDLFFSSRRDNAFEELAVPYERPGTYFVRVRRTAGEGVYTLQFKNRNTDLAGNSMNGAFKNLGNFVFNDLADQVSSFDTLDFYKFELAVQSDFDVAMTGMPAGTDTNLSLIRDSNGNGIVNKGEVLAISNNAGNASEDISRTLTPGVYFVRVKQITGTPTYHLRLVHDRVGNTLAKALPISQGGGTNLDFVGPEDGTDVYKFTLGTTRQIGVKVELNNEPLLIRLGQDINGNGLLDQVEERLSKTIDTLKGGFVRVNLNAGLANFLLVKSALNFPDEGTPYRVTVFNAKPDGAGNTLTDARDIGTLGDAQAFSDPLGRGPVVQMDDLNDFYKFTLGDNGPFQFVSQFSNVAGIVGFQLIRNDNQNPRIDSGEILATVTSPVANAPPPPISIRLDVPGTYYLNAFSTSTAAYTVNMRAISLDTAGNSLDGAPPPRDLGPLVNTIISPNHFVGAIDRDDFFRFSVNNPGELVASLSGAPNTAYRVIRDIDNDGVVDLGETLASAFGSRPLHGIVLPAADDNYFVHVQAIGSNSVFALTLTFSNQLPFIAPFLISATVPTEIKAVRFDKGGQGVSYGDTTGGNGGNDPAFRSGENIDVDVSTTFDPASGGRRVTNTAPEEFLEYTINVAEIALYDFDVRVSSPDLGATFRVLIDNVSVSSSPIAIPDTNGADNMVTIAAASNVILTAGFHVLRLAIITGTGVNNNFAGSFNFITVRPATAGTFEVTPPTSVVRAYDHTNLALAWTVPVGGWRTLQQVDLRLRDDSGRLIWIRFDEASNTMSLYNQTTGKFETDKEVGSYGVLRSPLANVYMRTTTIAANGANDPTVVISFDIKFKASARGHWTIEAAASDDLGHHDPFKFAGTLDVV